MNRTAPWIRVRHHYRCDRPRHPSYFRISASQYRVTRKRLSLKRPRKVRLSIPQTVSASTDNSQSDPPSETDGALEETDFE